MRDAAAHRGTNDSDVRMTLPLCSAQPALASKHFRSAMAFVGTMLWFHLLYVVIFMSGLHRTNRSGDAYLLMMYVVHLLSYLHAWTSPPRADPMLQLVAHMQLTPVLFYHLATALLYARPPGVADLHDTEDEEQDPPEGTSTSTCSNDNDSNLLPAPATFERQPRYNIEDHLNTSANMNDSANSSGMDARSDRASGCSTPRFLSNGWDLVDRAGRLFESLWDQQLEILIQMLYQELRRLATCATSQQASTILNLAANQGLPFVEESMESEILLAPRWRLWLHRINEDAHHAGPLLNPEDGSNADEEYEDSVSLMAVTRPRQVSKRSPECDRESERREERRERSRRRDDGDRDRERHLHPGRPHGLSTAPWRARPRSPAHPPPRNHASRGSSSVRSTHNGPSQAEQALSMNRHTWRNLLCLSDEGPGTDVTRHLSVPLPSEAMENVLETVHNMPTEHRVAFLASLLRFLLEVAQQISEVVVTNDVNADPNHITEDDVTMLVQLSSTVASRARLQFQALQQSLDKEGHQASHKAAIIRARIKQYFSGLLDEVPAEIHELDAMLLTYEAETSPCNAPRIEAEGSQWIQVWWMQLERTFAVINSEAGLQVPPLPCNAPAAIDLDTPPQAEATRDERDLHDLRLQEQQAAEEEERLLEMVKAFEEQQRARHAQEQDDKAMAEALAEKVDKRRRLQLNVTVSTSSSSGTSRARLHLPNLTEGEEANIHLKLTRKPAEGQDLAVEDATSLMQRGLPHCAAPIPCGHSSPASPRTACTTALRYPSSSASATPTSSKKYHATLSAWHSWRSTLPYQPHSMSGECGRTRKLHPGQHPEH